MIDNNFQIDKVMSVMDRINKKLTTQFYCESLIFIIYIALLEEREREKSLFIYCI